MLYNVWLRCTVRRTDSMPRVWQTLYQCRVRRKNREEKRGRKAGLVCSVENPRFDRSWGDEGAFNRACAPRRNRQGRRWCWRVAWRRRRSPRTPSLQSAHFHPAPTVRLSRPQINAAPGLSRRLRAASRHAGTPARHSANPRGRSVNPRRHAASPPGLSANPTKRLPNPQGLSAHPQRPSGDPQGIPVSAPSLLLSAPILSANAQSRSADPPSLLSNAQSRSANARGLSLDAQSRSLDAQRR